MTCRRRSPARCATCPTGIQPPTYRKSNSDASPILILSMNSDQLSRTELNEWAETFLAQRLSTIEGVAQVQVYGSAKYAVRIQLDPGAMASRGIGIDEVQAAVSNGNSNLPAGVLMGPNQSFTVQATGQLQSAAAFRQLVVAYRNGAPVRLGDLGDVLDDVQNNRAWSDVNGRANIALAIVRQPGTNTVAVADAVTARIDELRPQLAGLDRVPAHLRPRRRHPRVGARRAVHARAHARARGARDLPVPAERARHVDPLAGAPVLDRGHVQRDVGARLLAEQPHADGAHAVGGLRGGRRHRDAREHRAPPGDGQDADAGGARRLEGDQLHDPVDHAVAGRGVHSRSCSCPGWWDGCSRSSP